jgi:DNA-binding MarR family transcriptional regulator/GNAT superfamily N-acetyltransferase
MADDESSVGLEVGMGSGQGLVERVGAVRRFNRFYTRQIGLLGEGYLDSPFSLTEVRVLYELAHQGPTTAATLARELGLDEGYLSRIMRGFEQRGLIVRRQAGRDARQREVSLSDLGRAAFAPLEARSGQQLEALLGRLDEYRQERLLASMATIEALLGEAERPSEPYSLRSPRAGELGWVVQRHGAIYAQEYGWDVAFEGLVAGIVAHFVEHFDPARERCWIAELDGEPVGSVFVVQGSESYAKLRLLLVEPRARGLGIGRRLVNECIQFARAAGYRELKLWTNSCLLAARAIYQQAGFRLTESEQHHSFGHDLVGETWELRLDTPDAQPRARPR